MDDQLSQLRQRLDDVERFLLIEDLAKVADAWRAADADADGAAGAHRAAFETDSAAGTTDALRAVLSDTDNQTIRNAAYMMMSETLKEAGRTDEALALLQQGLKENVRQVK